MSEGATAYLWNFGNDETSDEFEPSTIYTTPGTYQVVLNAFNDVCSDQFIIEIEVGDNSIAEQVQNSLQVYPNPTSGLVTIQSGAQIDEVIVYDMTGRAVQTLNLSTVLVDLNLSALAQGTYVVEVITANGTQTVRVIKR